jgi:uncharacterized membrane protein HdeD (DUF308 family)
MYYGAGHTWWILALRGILSIIFGVIALVWPSILLGALIVLIGIFVLVDGVLLFGFALSNRDGLRQWILLLAIGIIGMLVGLILLAVPEVTLTALIYVLAIWAVITGIMQLIAAWNLRHVIERERMLALSGLFTLIFGLLVLFRPGLGLFAIAALFAFYAIFYGVFTIAAGLRLRELR